MTQNVPRDSNIPQTQPPTLPKPISLTSTGLSGLTSEANSSNVSRASRIAETQRPAIDSVSDKATTAFIRRTLCAHNVLSSNLGNGEKGRSTPRPIDELLPPLTSSNDVDLHLYAIIAVIIKEFVYTWYSKITPDHVFVNEVIQVIAHCTRGLEQRLRKVDLEALLLDEIPELLEAHLNGGYSWAGYPQVKTANSVTQSLPHLRKELISQSTNFESSLRLPHATPASCAIACTNRIRPHKCT